MADIGTLAPQAGSYGTAPPQQSPQQMMDPRKKRLIDQIMQNRQQASQQTQMGMMGGPSYLDQLDQMRMNPMNTWF